MEIAIEVEEELRAEIPHEYTEPCPRCHGEKTVVVGTAFTFKQLQDYKSLPREECWNCQGSGRVPSVEKLWRRVQESDKS